MEINLPVVSVGRVGNRSRSPLSFCKASFGKRRCGRFQVLPYPFSFGGFTTELRIGGTQTPVPFTKNALLAWTFAKSTTESLIRHSFQSTPPPRYLLDCISRNRLVRPVVRNGYHNRKDQQTDRERERDRTVFGRNSRRD